MGIETIDLLLIHRPDPLMDHHETGATLDDLVASGKVRSVGVSNFRPWDWELLQSAMTSRLVTNQIEISVLAHHPFTNGDIAFLQRHGIPPMAWSPLAGGALFAPENKPIHDSLAAIAARYDNDVTSLVVAWLMAHPARIMPVMGTNSLQRIASFGAAAGISIDRETWYEIYTIARGEEVA
jgi:predicted oxidoreductase